MRARDLFMLNRRVDARCIIEKEAAPADSS